MVEKSKKYKKIRQIFFQIFLVGVFIWIFDSIMGYFFFYEGNSFWDLLILDIPIPQLYIRSTFFIVLTVFGYIIYTQFKKQEILFNSRIKIEEELIQSQKRLNTIFQAIPDLYFMISRDGTYLEYKGHEGDLYVPAETFLGKKAKDFMPKELVERINVAIPKLYNTKQPQTIEYSLKMPDGKKRYFQSQMLYYSKEKHVSFTRDITEIKLNEQKLRISELRLKERYKELNCIYSISKLQDDPILSIEKLFKESMKIIIPAFQFPDIACSKIIYRSKSYASENFKETDWKLSESIKIDDNFIVVTVCYLENKQFLQEEVLMLKNIINRFKNIIENRNSEEIRRDFNKKLEKEVRTKTEELRVVMDQLKAIWDNIIDPIMVISEDFRILFSNRSAQNVFGKNLVGNLCYEKFKGLKSSCDFCPLFPENRVIIFDTLVEHVIKIPKTGESRTFEISISKIKNFQGKPAMLESLRDVTDRKITEDKLKESESISQERVMELDSLYGISRLLAKPNISINKLLRNSIPLILDVWPNPEKMNVRIAYGLYEHKSENYKETIWKLSTLEFVEENPLKIDVFSQDEESLHIEKINVLKEIGDRIHMSISRREAELETNKYVSIVRDSNDAIVVSDLKGTITSWNKSAEIIYGYSAKEIVGNSLISLIPLDRIDENSFIINEIRKGNQIDHYETKRLRKDGKILDISITASPIKNLINEIIGLSAISRDFTDVNEAQNLFKEEILKSSAFKSDFMASMSHELRTPLNSIIGFSDILLEKYYGDLNEKQYHYVNNVRTSADHLLELINDILDISKIEAGKMELNITNIQLSKIINTVENILKPEFDKKNLTFEVIGLEEKKLIQADSVRLQEIMFNLLSNAVKYTKEGGIKLEIIESQDFWTFNIKDTGVGIKEEDFDLVFQEFKRINSDYIASIEGTGLGLSLTKKLVELHDGNLSFTSEFGKGSTFTFTIPKIEISTERNN